MMQSDQVMDSFKRLVANRGAQDDSQVFGLFTKKYADAVSKMGKMTVKLYHNSKVFIISI